MFSIANLLDSAKAKAGIESDYRLGKVIGINHQVISGYRMGKSLPSEAIIEQLCALSGDDPDVIAAQIQAARSKSPEAKTMWLRVAARMAGNASTAFLSVLITIVLIAAIALPARAGESLGFKVSKETVYTSYQVAFLSVGAFLMARLRQIPGLFWFCRMALS